MAQILSGLLPLTSGEQTKQIIVPADDLGRQLEEKPYKRYTYTPGDLYDETGKRVYLKPANE